MFIQGSTPDLILLERNFLLEPFLILTFGPEAPIRDHLARDFLAIRSPTLLFPSSVGTAETASKTARVRYLHLHRPFEVFVSELETIHSRLWLLSMLPDAHTTRLSSRFPVSGWIAASPPSGRVIVTQSEHAHASVVRYCCADYPDLKRACYPIVRTNALARDRGELTAISQGDFRLQCALLGSCNCELSSRREVRACIVIGSAGSLPW